MMQPVKLNNGITIPPIGFGTWQIKDETTCIRAVQSALEAGYRHLDTAQIYDNEAFVGKAGKASGVPREEVFITTKIWNENQFWDDLIPSFEELLRECSIKPAVNQVELHVYLQQPELVKYCQNNGIVVEAYSPLAHGDGLDEPTLTEIAKKHNKTPTQVMIRWCIDQGTVPLPRSIKPEHIKANLDVFDFTLDENDMAKLKALEKDYRTCWDPTNVA